MSKVIIIGGGAAGMLAAIAAANNGKQVIVFEQNEKLGKKIFITGKGRCNLTNACDVETLFQNVVTNEKFMYSAFYGFDNQETIRFFESIGLRTKIERGDRVFPASDHSSDVIKVLKEEMKRKEIQVFLNTKVKRITTQSYENEGNEKTQGYINSITGVILENGREEKADSVIVATGGLSYPTTGARGDGYKIAAGSGHKLKEAFPALVPLAIKESFCKDLQGLALKNVKASIINSKRKIIYEDFGEMLFTHYGVSGPIILSASSYITDKIGKEKFSLFLDLKPALSEEQLDKRILRDFEDNRQKQFKNALNGLFPTRIIPVMIETSGIVPEKKIFEITKEERKAFVHCIKNFQLTITGTGDFNEAIITKGGVSVKDINPSTMESKKVKGLYFAGEVLDIDALTGGFNLQVAWSTGHLAGASV